MIKEGEEANITLEDATLQAYGGAGIHTYSGSTLNLTLIGDNVPTGTDNNASLNAGEGQTLVIIEASTGKLTVTGGNDAAGISGGRFQSGGSITIHGGTIIARSSDAAAGIGCGFGAISADYFAAQR